MTCCTLDLVGETFGVPIEQSVVGRTLQRGEWLGITMAVRIGTSGQYTYATVDQTYDVAGVSVKVAVPSGGLVGVTVSGRQFNLPWRPSFPGATNLLVARFQSADFLVFRDADSSTNQWSFFVVDLRPGTRCAAVTGFGPYVAPATFEINFCPSDNGLLAMLWHGAMPNTVTGRRAWVVRTTVDVNRQPPLLTVDDLGASGTLGCEVRMSDRTIMIFDKAYRQGNIAVSRITNQANPLNNSRDLASNSLPAPGKVRLSPQSVKIDASETTESFQIENIGGDFLEVVSVTSGNVAVSASPSDSLPRCIWPGETIAVVLTRASNAAANTAVTVGTLPAATPASAGVVNVQMLAKAVVTPRPAATVVPPALSWRVGTQDSRQIGVRNTGNVNIDVHVAAAASSSGFTWNEVRRRTMLPNETVSVSVAPKSTGPDNDTLTVEAFDTASNMTLTGFPFPVPLTKNVPIKVPVGTLRITALLGDAPGSDIAPEGEFIEIVNTTNGPLDLSGCRITHETRPPQGSPRELSLVAFGPNAFGTDAMLAPFSATSRPLRILTRGRAASDPANDRLRYYCNLKGPVWNNTGDVARIYNEANQVVASWTYVTSYPAPGTSLPPGTVVSPPPAKRRIATRRVYVNANRDWTTVFNVEDGDVVRIRDVTRRITLGGFLGAAGDSGPEGRVNDPAPSGPQRPDPFGPEMFFPVPGFPKYGLVGQIGQLHSDGSITVVIEPFFVGASSTITVTIPNQRGPLMLFLGVNDDLLSDNGGYFDCVADLSR